MGFYTISNLQSHLPLPPVGAKLIKGAVNQLVEESKTGDGFLSDLDTFCTLSPVPGFRRWITQLFAEASFSSAEAGQVLGILNETSNASVQKEDLDHMMLLTS